MRNPRRRTDDTPQRPRLASNPSPHRIYRLPSRQHGRRLLLYPPNPRSIPQVVLRPPMPRMHRKPPTQSLRQLRPSDILGALIRFRPEPISLLRNRVGPSAANPVHLYHAKRAPVGARSPCLTALGYPFKMACARR